MKLRFLHIVLSFFIALGCNAQIDELQRDFFRAKNYVSASEIDSAVMIWKTHAEIPEFAFCLANYYLETENYTEALKVCRSIVDKDPSETYFLMARIYAGMGFAEESISCLEKQFSGKNKKIYSEILKSDEFEYINRTSEWREFWATPRYSKTEETYADIEYQISQGKYEYAIELLDEMSQTKSSVRNYLYAKAYCGMKNFAQAEKYIDVSLQNNSKNVKYLSLKFEIQKLSGKYSDAYNTGKMLLLYDRFNPDNLLEYAEVCAMAKKGEVAKRFTDSYLKCFPNDEKALFLGSKVSLSSQGEYEALANLSKLIEINPSNPEYYKLRGETYYKYEMWNLAFYDFSMALDITPDDARLNFLTGMCKYNMASYEKACFYWRRAATEKSKEAAEMYYRYCEE